MKHSIKQLVMIVTILVSGIVYGQEDYSFRVLANKGTSQVKKASGQSESLKAGMKLMSNDQLIVTAGSYIGLMHKSGKTIEVRETGTQKIADLEKKVPTGTTTTASKYAQFIAQKMNDDGSVKPSQKMNATGAVSREVGGANGIAIYLPNLSTFEFVGKTAVISWTPTDLSSVTPGTTYVVTVTNIYDEPVITKETTEAKVFLTLDDEELNTESGLYKVQITVKGNEELASDIIGLKRVDADEKADLLEAYTVLTQDVSESGAMNKLIYAQFFEENSLFVDAMAMYEQVIQESPEIEDFKELYKAFLVGNEMKSDF